MSRLSPLIFTLFIPLIDASTIVDGSTTGKDYAKRWCGEKKLERMKDVFPHEAERYIELYLELSSSDLLKKNLKYHKHRFCGAFSSSPLNIGLLNAGISEMSAQLASAADIPVSSDEDYINVLLHKGCKFGGTRSNEVMNRSHQFILLRDVAYKRAHLSDKTVRGFKHRFCTALKHDPNGSDMQKVMDDFTDTVAKFYH